MTYLKKRSLIIFALLGLTGLCAHAGTVERADSTKLTETAKTAEAVRTSEPAKTAEITKYTDISEKQDTGQTPTIQDASEKEDTGQTPAVQDAPAQGTAPKAWQVYLSPDLPEPYIEVLKQYESFLNTDKSALSDDDLLNKFHFDHGEWKYVCQDLSGIWISPDSGWKYAGQIPCYALADLTGDGFPELIMGWGGELIPEVIYTYSGKNGVEMSYFVSSYFTLTIYETGILKVDSAGAYSTTTYLQFQEDVQDWVMLDKIAVLGSWDSESGQMNDTEFFKLAPGENGDPDMPISEEEYRRIKEKYDARPMELKWAPLVYDKINPWYSYDEDADLIYEHDFMTSRDGQGFHWWIYLETAYILRDYGRRIGYDLMSDHWTVEHICPIEGGYYHILLSQDNHDVVLDLLCDPDDQNNFAKRRYVILYAQYENGRRIAGINEIPYDSQLAWQDFDYNMSYEMPPVENPFGDLYETSIYQACYIALYQYGQETGYDGEWYIRQIYGRSPFFDYLVGSENSFLWICADIGQHCYTYVPLMK